MDENFPLCVFFLYQNGLDQFKYKFFSSYALCGWAGTLPHNISPLPAEYLLALPTLGDTRGDRKAAGEEGTCSFSFCLLFLLVSSHPAGFQYPYLIPDCIFSETALICPCLNDPITSQSQPLFEGLGSCPIGPLL